MELKKISSLFWMCVMTLVTVLLNTTAYAADYAVYSQPLYALDTQNELDTNAFTITADWFMTTSVAEMNNAVSEGWDSRGIACYTSPAQIPGTVPLYRIYNIALRDHIFTSNVQEYNTLQKVFYKPEGIVGYVFPKNNQAPGTVPLYRFFAGGKHSYHRYSLSPTKVGDENYEGIECYVWPKGQAVVSLQITRPQMNEELKGFGMYDISWNASIKGGYIALNYSTDAGNTWKPIEYGLENKGFAKWRVPNINTQHGRIKITWTDNLFGETNMLAETISHYDFRIKQTNLQAQSIAKAIQKLNPPSAPTAFGAKFTLPLQVQLSWQASAGAPIAYIIEKRTAEGVYQQAATIKASGLTYVDKNITPGTTYFYRVYAVNMGGRSAHSNESSVKTAFTLKRPVAGMKKLP
jgi:hypothetical protein